MFWYFTFIIEVFTVNRPSGLVIYISNYRSRVYLPISYGKWPPRYVMWWMGADFVLAPLMLPASSSGLFVCSLQLLQPCYWVSPAILDYPLCFIQPCSGIISILCDILMLLFRGLDYMACIGMLFVLTMETMYVIFGLSLLPCFVMHVEHSFNLWLFCADCTRRLQK